MKPNTVLHILLILNLLFISPSAMSIMSGKRVLVTGGGRGIGRAIAQICAREGAQVAICSRTESQLEETASTVSPHSMDTYVADLTNEEQVDSMVKSIVQKWGGIDVLINNAGRGQKKGPAYTLKAEDLSSLLHLNVVAVHIVTSSVLQQSMLENENPSRIINVSSKAGKVGLPNNSFYVTSKFALEGYSAAIAEELKDKNIIVNTISPGMVNTESFPKPEGKKGVRTAESIKDGLLLLMQTEKTGHYLHVDELDEARQKGFDGDVALKDINEAKFQL